MSNLSEEEKKAIEMIKDRQKDLLESSENSFYSSNRKLYKEHAEQINVILNLIEKQQKEIEILKSKIDAKEKVHEYDMQMIDELKGQVVEQTKEIEELKEYKYMYEDLCK